MYTPPNSDGCVDGSMRKLLISIIQRKYKLTYKSLNIEDVKESDEIILSNAISGIKKVSLFRDKEFNEDSFYNYLLQSLNKLI